MKTLMLTTLLFVSEVGFTQPSPVVQALVTQEEASRPDAHPRQTRGLFPGPSIKLVVPTEDAINRPLRSPLRLKFIFNPRNEAKIDVSSVRLMYLKSPSADLTPRILSSITAGGIDLARVNLPPGRHNFLVSVVDTNGNRGVASYGLTVLK